MAKIKGVTATEILDSRGNPTIEATVTLQDGTVGIASCPSGASVSGYEALELRDRDQSRYNGMGVLKAIENVQTYIAPKLVGTEVTKQAEIDKMMIELDGTQNKARLGGNTILAVSMAVARAGAKNAVLPLYLYLRQFVKKDHTALRIPTPLFNILNGGKHASGNIDFQEFIITPASSKEYAEGLQMGDAIYQMLKQVLTEKNFSSLVGDEGGFGPILASNKDALLLLRTAIDRTPYRFGYDVFMGIDVAANSFYKDGKYVLKEMKRGLSADELNEYYRELFKEYPVLYLEDPYSEDDWEGWSKFAAENTTDRMVVGDDLVSTNPYRLQMALDKKVISGVIIKPNQIGTVIEALAVTEVAKEAGLKITVSHRSGETDDDFIADFAVAVGAHYVKFGAPVRGERIAKYNRLLHIEKQFKTLNAGIPPTE